MKKTKAFIISAVSLCLCLGGIYFYLIFLSFSKFNVLPKTIVENFLSETYYGEFTLRDTDFYIEQGYYIWEYEFTDEEGIDFCEYYRHPVERSLDNPGKYVFFDRNRTGGVYDFYWQEKMCRECTDELILKKYQVNEGPHSGRIRYSFDLQEEDNDEIVNIITKLYTYVFRNTKKPENVPLGCTIKYGEKYLYSIGADETDAIYLYAGYEDEKILDYITQRLNTEWQNHFCLLTEENENYILHIKDINGNTIFNEEYETEPIVKRIDDNTLMIIRGKGDWHTYTFVNVRTSLVSENFDAVSAWKL